jgi:hypothetical protein
VLETAFLFTKEKVILIFKPFNYNIPMSEELKALKVDEIVVVNEINKVNELLKQGFRIIKITKMTRTEQLEGGKTVTYDFLTFVLGKRTSKPFSLWNPLKTGGEWAFADSKELKELVEKIKSTGGIWKDDRYVYTLSKDGRFIRRVEANAIR